MRYGLILAALLLPLGGQVEAAMHHAAGKFEVTVVPAEDAGVAALMAARWSITKTYAGPLTATAHAIMLSAGNPAAGSAGYAAIERVEGTLDGRAGSFALVHLATMNKGGQAMQVTVVPGSGTGALAGITGTLTIRIEGGQHFYTLDYDVAS